WDIVDLWTFVHLAAALSGSATTSAAFSATSTAAAATSTPLGFNRWREVKGVFNGHKGNRNEQGDQQSSGHVSLRHSARKVIATLGSKFRVRFRGLQLSCLGSVPR